MQFMGKNVHICLRSVLSYRSSRVNHPRHFAEKCSFPKTTPPSPCETPPSHPFNWQFLSIFGTIGTSSTGHWSQLEASMDAVPGGSTVPPQVLTTAASLAAAALEDAHVTPALLKETTKGHKGVEKMGDT